MVEFTHCESPFNRCRFHSAAQLAGARLDESQVYSAGRRKKLKLPKLLRRRLFLRFRDLGASAPTWISGARMSR
jgi:hypothetical protein